ncbi:hypothetical protein CABS01_06587 [Colletotrichum abscissum]|uniref:Uncharacterized protein n=4 Tax=Colletotrichum acutatum species complex TaxID=2707335 RepID=A0A9Q8SAD4_9PEZI|nr:uncharacterized protein CLUP02_00113 [Colletotrichum lupini]XP_060310412.1 uncharacterized protein CCOS01_10455 [Colletotrichum costaricense]XP_060382143.1 uncharacterized protein CTAM01_07382 [Colletotrichum tamarilloi]XP_060403637.1 uncharacterized protein CABS01_06587 [Colletotrichum abscissum]KAI3536965.1 hypothetical protein CSPX01_10462 [Colletotrichum filicis]KAK1463156.1 hypothetical protein CMEL01_13225 [Colletotrichum melonis]KAK1498653.1 hypothetical protein CTAM01_07382 [Collet
MCSMCPRKYRHTCWTVLRYTTMRRMSCLCLR